MFSEKKRHPRWALNLPLHTFLKHQTIKRFVGNKKHSYSLSFNVPRRLRPILTTSRSSHWGPHAFQMPTRSDPLVLFLERLSRFSLTAFYTTFIYGAQANIDGCNTNLDSIFFVEMKAFRSTERPNPPNPSTSWSFLMTHDLLMLVLAIALALIPYVFIHLLTNFFEEHPH